MPSVPENLEDVSNDASCSVVAAPGVLSTTQFVNTSTRDAGTTYVAPATLPKLTVVVALDVIALYQSTSSIGVTCWSRGVSV